MPGSWNPRDLPYLTDQDHVVTSTKTTQYNCIAWAIGDDKRWWWPTGRYYWPTGVQRTVTLEAFSRALESVGYLSCNDPSLEEGVEKLALYAKANEFGEVIPTHAARQLVDGNWTSKLGPQEDITHFRTDRLNSPTYGQVLMYFARPRIA